MTNEEMTIKLTEHHKEIGSLKHRVDNLERQGNTLQELAISVNELAINMKAMLKEQEKQSEKIESLEAAPKKKWENLVTVIITALASALVTFVVTSILSNIL